MSPSKKEDQSLDFDVVYFALCQKKKEGRCERSTFMRKHQEENQGFMQSFMDRQKQQKDIF